MARAGTLEVAWGPNGLVPAIAQDAGTGRVLMLAWMNEEALQLTLERGYVHYWSRSRRTLWKKGETSGHLQRVVDVALDCDGDALLVRVEQVGGRACHTGRESCFYRDLEGNARDASPLRPEEVLPRLGRTIEARRSADPSTSWTARLLAGGVASVGAKIDEEAAELVAALAAEGDEAVVHEAADLVYHALVGLAARGLGFDALAAELARRFGVGGLDEKAGRPS